MIKQQIERLVEYRTIQGFKYASCGGVPNDRVLDLEQYLSKNCEFPAELGELLSARNGEIDRAEHGLLERYLWLLSHEEIRELHGYTVETAIKDISDDFEGYVNIDPQVKRGAGIEINWIPFGLDNKDPFLIDMSPSELGSKGQVIYTRGEEGAAWFVSHSLTCFLDLYLQALELGYKNPFVNRDLPYNGEAQLPRLFELKKGISVRV